MLETIKYYISGGKDIEFRISYQQREIFILRELKEVGVRWPKDGDPRETVMKIAKILGCPEAVFSTHLRLGSWIGTREEPVARFGPKSLLRFHSPFTLEEIKAFPPKTVIVAASVSENKMSEITLNDLLSAIKDCESYAHCEPLKQ